VREAVTEFLEVVLAQHFAPLAIRTAGHREQSYHIRFLFAIIRHERRPLHMEFLVTVPLLIVDDLGMRKLPLTAAEELLEIIMRRYERASTMLTSNRPVEDWGKLLGDAAAVSAMLDRLLHHGHVLKCGPRSWRTRLDAQEQ
jgi:DNA replication protein DnaC